MRVQLEFVPADCWIGIFWRRSKDWYTPTLHVWVCLIPCFPLHFVFERSS